MLSCKSVVVSAASAVVLGVVLVGCSSSQMSSTDNTGTGSTAEPSSAQPSGDMSDQTAITSSGQMAGQMSAQDFVNQAALSGQFEVQSSRLILSKTDNQATRQFAQQMVDDHQKANDELKSIAQRKNLSVPSGLDQQYRVMLNQIRDVSDPRQATQQYDQTQLQAHQQAVDLFQRASQQLQDPDLKAFATRTLPILRQHLQHIQSIQQGSGAM